MKAIIGWRSKKSLFVLVIIGPILLYYIVFTFYPMFIGLVASFYRWNIAVGMKDRHFVGLRNYINVFTDEVARKSLVNTLLFTAYVVPALTVISLLTGIFFDHTIRRLRSFFTVAYFLPNITSLVALSLMWKWLYHPAFGMINYFMGIVGLPYMTWLENPKQALPAIAIMTIWRAIGYNAVIFLAGLQGIPETFHEAATIDGASVFKKFTRITLPLLIPTLVFSLVMSVIGSMTTFTQIYVMTRSGAGASMAAGGPARSTTTIALYIYETGIKYLELGQASALAYVLFLIILIFTYVQLRLMRTEWRY